ncbi:MAG: hypothetical protein MUC47_11895 [Candidatus Kapabacteria bacterium]|nr:hypothetical protein [Candidatus Kapabacteria bacterium]
MILYILFFLCCAVATARQPRHPLSNPTKADAERIINAIRADSRTPGEMMFVSVGLDEPTKADYAAYRATGRSLPHRIRCITYDPVSKVLYEIAGETQSGVITEFKRIDGVQPWLTQEDQDTTTAVLSRHKGFQLALQRRNLTFDSIAIETWASGVPLSTFKSRIVRCVFFQRSQGQHRYDRPIEGLHVLVNLTQKTVMEFHDRTLAPIAKPEAWPPSIKRSGKSLPVCDQFVSWKQWKFTLVPTPREGVVLYDVSWKDGATQRMIAHRISLSEMLVPYGDTSSAWSWRNAFDVGEYGLGVNSRSLEPNVDIPTTSRTLPLTVISPKGAVTTLQNIIAVYERDAGIQYKHVDVATDRMVGRRGVELVVMHVTTIGNYDYAISYVFSEDGTITVDVGLTGILLAKGIQDTVYSVDSQKTAHMVAPALAAPLHQHFFSFRMDMDVDGEKNTVSEIDVWSPDQGRENPQGNAIMMDDYELRFEAEARRHTNPATARRWVIRSATSTNAFGMPTGYCLMPGTSVRPYLTEGHAVRKRAGFADYAFWATQYREGEFYASGSYPNQNVTSTGLPAISQDNAVIRNQDVVIWYTMGVTHVPRPEEWPIMPMEHVRFSLVPMGFFDRNPLLPRK